MSLAEWKVQVVADEGLVAIDWSQARCQDGAATMTALLSSASAVDAPR